MLTITTNKGDKIYLKDDNEIELKKDVSKQMQELILQNGDFNPSKLRRLKVLLDVRKSLTVA